MIGASDYLNNIPKQFISVGELLGLFSKLEKMTLEESAQWFVNNIHLLNKSKKLVLKNSYTLIEYEYNDNDFYNCPIETIRLIANGEDEEFSSDYVGFSRFLLLKELDSIGLDIDKNILLNSRPYISKSCYESDDNFYKNQCVYLKEDLDRLKDMNTSIAQEEDIPRIHFLDKEHNCYVPLFALILHVHQDVNYTERYSDKTVQKDRIFAFLEDYGEHYNYRATDTHSAVLSQIIPNRKDAKIKATQAIGRALAKK